MRVVTEKQRTTEWLQARCGCVTASNMGAVMSKYKLKSKLESGAETAERRNYKTQVVVETLTGRVQENFVSPAMQWGMDNEELAFAAYEIKFDLENPGILHTGFVLHPTINRAGASPDGLIGKEGMIEVKCPDSTTHLEYLLADAVPEEYQPQMLWEMVCCERQWCDFVSYDPRMPEHLQLFVKRFPRDAMRISLMEQEVHKFMKEVDDVIARLPRPDGSRIDLVGVLEESVARSSK